MGRKLKSIVNKVNDDIIDSKQNETAPPKRRKVEKIEQDITPKNRSATRSTAKSTNSNSKTKKSSVRRKLEGALALDKSLNAEEPKTKEMGKKKEISVAESLMYAILPGKSRFLNSKGSKIIQGSQELSVSDGDSQLLQNQINAKDSNLIPADSMDTVPGEPSILENKMKNANTNRNTVKLPLSPNVMNFVLGNEEKLKETNDDGRDNRKVIAVNDTPFKMRVDPGEELEFGTDSEDESDNSEMDDSQDLGQFEHQSDDDKQIPAGAMPILDFAEFSERPEVKDFMLKMYQATVDKGSGAKPSLLQQQARAVNNIKLQVNSKSAEKPKATKRKIPTGNFTDPVKGACRLRNSFSDETMYVPALHKKRTSKTVRSPDYVEKCNRPLISEIKNKRRSNENEIINHLINDIRLNDFPADNQTQDRVETGPSLPSIGTVQQTQENQPRDHLDELSEKRCQQDRARQIADRAIVEAEKFRAVVATPTGKSDLSVPPVDLSFNDDHAKNFCQVSNHVDTPTEQKIAVGAFLELVKLAPGRTLKLNDNTDKKLELVSKEGKTFYLPFSEKEQNKITNFKKWEDAFKVYAAIYTKYNPHRGAEIYQYVHSIQLASMSYHWDNVAYYDYHFRKLMAENPQRSWSKVNTQLWSLAMRDPIPSKLTSGFNGNTSFGGHNGQQVKKTVNNEWKDVCCWRYNKNRCSKKAGDCKFEHRCSHCGSFSHIYLNCNRRRRGSNDQNQHGGDNSNDNTKTKSNNHSK